MANWISTELEFTGTVPTVDGVPGRVIYQTNILNVEYTVEARGDTIVVLRKHREDTSVSICERGATFRERVLEEAALALFASRG